MKPINLLPRAPYINRRFVPLLIALCTALLLVTALLAYLNVRWQSRSIELAEEASRVQRQLGLLMQARQPDAITQCYEQLLQAVEPIRAERKDWTAIFADVAAPLPLSSRLVSAQLSTPGVLKLEYQFMDLADAAAYMTVLQGNSRFSEVQVEGVTSQSFTYVDTPAATPTPVPTATPKPSATPKPTPLTKEQTERMLEEAARKRGSTEEYNEAMSNVLRQRINEALAESWLRNAPPGSTAAPDAIGGGYGELSQQDIQRSWNNLLKLRQLASGEGFDLNETTTGPDPTSNLVEPVGVVLYRMSIQLTLS